MPENLVYQATSASSSPPTFFKVADGVTTIDPLFRLRNCLACMAIRATSALGSSASGPGHLGRCAQLVPFNELMFKAMTVHRQHHDPNTVQLSTLLSIKTGACPEDCAYCPQSARYKTGLKTEKLMPLDQIIAAATRAKENGAKNMPFKESPGAGLFLPSNTFEMQEMQSC